MAHQEAARIAGCFVVVAVTALIAGGCGSKSTTATSERIQIKSLKGEIIFTRAGGTYGDETLYRAHANGTHQRRLSGYGKTCCVRWSPDGCWPCRIRC